MIDRSIERRWTELQGVAGTAEAVPILQAIVKASPDGEVSVSPFLAPLRSSHTLFG